MEVRESALWNLNRRDTAIPFISIQTKNNCCQRQGLMGKKTPKKKHHVSSWHYNFFHLPIPSVIFHVTSHPSHPHPAAFHCLVGLQAPAPFLWSWDLRSWWCWKEVSTWCCSQNVLTLFHLKISIYSFIHLLIYYFYWFMNSLADSFICLFMYLFKHAKYRV